MPPSIPDGIPILQRGRHRRPAEGACLMEATALLAGQPHTDHPGCVHPLIAAVARIVNDAVSDTARHELLRFAPAAAATATDAPHLIDDLIILVCNRALPVAVPLWAPSLRRALRQAHRRRRRRPASISRRQLRQAEAAVRYATASLVLAAHTERDRELTALLSDCLALADAAIGRLTPHGPQTRNRLASAPAKLARLEAEPATAAADPGEAPLFPVCIIVRCAASPTGENSS